MVQQTGKGAVNVPGTALRHRAEKWTLVSEKAMQKQRVEAITRFRNRAGLALADGARGPHDNGTDRGGGRRDALLLGGRPGGLSPLPRPRMGPARDRRPPPVREDLPRGFPVRPVVADDPAQAREFPRRLRRLRLRQGRGLRRRRMSSACCRTPASCAIAARSSRPSTMRAAPRN